MQIARIRGLPHCISRRCKQQAKARTRCVSVAAFLARDELNKAAQCVPSPFVVNEEVESCPMLVFDRTQYHSSLFFNDLFSEQGVADGAAQGPEAFADSLERWACAYTRDQAQHLAVAVDEQSQDAFLLFQSDLINTGSFAGAGPTGQRSAVVGLYRVHLDADGHATDVWLFRSGTAEERALLLKQETCAVLDPAAAAAAGLEMPAPDPTGSLFRGTSLLPCSWTVDSGYTAAITHHAEVWTHEVQSKGCLSSLMRVVSPDVMLMDGTGLMHGALKGPAAVGKQVLTSMLAWDVGTRVPLATVREPGGNKVFVHWAQSRTCRTSGAAGSHHGATLLVFDSQARVSQVIEFKGLCEAEKHKLFKADALCTVPVTTASMQSVGSSVSSMDNGSSASSSSSKQLAAMIAALRAGGGGGGMSAEERERREQQECLDRQAREWMSW